MKSHQTLSPAEYDRLRTGHLYRRRADLVARHVPAAGRIVDLGCGTGGLVAALARRFPQAGFVGVDADAEMIRYAETHNAAPNVRYACADVTAGAVAAEADLAYGVDVLHHVRDLDAFGRSVAQGLRAHGRWLVIEPNLLHPYVWLAQERMRRAGLDEDHFRPRDAERAFRSRGFDIESKRYFSLLPGFVRQVPAALEAVESAFERFRFAGGSVVYVLVRREDDVE